MEVLHGIPRSAGKRPQEVCSYQQGDVVNLEPEHGSGLLSRETSRKATEVEKFELWIRGLSGNHSLNFLMWRIGMPDVLTNIV